MADLRLGVFGTGALGRHHARILSQLPGAHLVGIHDQNPETAKAIASEHGLTVFDDPTALASEIEAAVVAVPTTAHEEVGVGLLEQGIHVLVEKPIAPSLEAADRLIAAAGDRVLAVGHVEFHNPAVQALLGAVRDVRYVEVQRLSPFSPRSLDVDVVLDLMIHDLQILHALGGAAVREIRATGIPVLSERIDMANVRLELESGLVANLTASRVSSERIRKLRAFLPSRYVSLDYIEQAIKAFRLDDASAERRIMPDPVEVQKAEPLKRELEAFVAACRGEIVPLVSGVEARRALATALAVVEAIGA